MNQPEIKFDISIIYKYNFFINAKAKIKVFIFIKTFFLKSSKICL